MSRATQPSRLIRARGGPFRRLSPHERRAQIIEVVANMFGERPYAELSVADVAAAAGITQGLVYHYFPNKEALCIAVFEQRASELLEKSRPPAGLPLPVQVEVGVKGYLDFVDANAMAYLNLFNGSSPTEAEVQRICDETRTRIVERFLEVLGIADQPLPATRLSMRGYVGYVEALIVEWLPERRLQRATIERLIVAVATSALMTGLEADGSLPQTGSLADFKAAYKEYFSLP